MEATVSGDPAFPAPGGAAVYLWWLGQAGFAIRRGADLLLVDPYLSDTLAVKYRGKLFPHARMVPPPVEAAEITGVSTVLCTHGHTDHMDPGSIADLHLANDPLFVIPRSEAAKGAERGIRPTRLLGLDAGESVTFTSGITVHAVPAAHEDVTVDESGQNLFLGYVIDIDGLRIYHSGDCAPYDGQAGIIRALDVDLALLPVNGRDEYRRSNGVPGNFHWHEAVDLCRSAGVPRLLCHHWGMFEFNSADPVELRARLADVTDIDWIVPELGRPYALAIPPRTQ